jgi:hypothetical protein
MSCDTKMIAMFEDGWDYHDLVSKKVGCDRRQAKAINFGIVYGKGITSLAADLGVDPEAAGEYLRVWDEQAPVGAQWRAERPDLYAQERGLRTPRRWIPALHPAQQAQDQNYHRRRYYQNCQNLHCRLPICRFGAASNRPGKIGKLALANVIYSSALPSNQGWTSAWQDSKAGPMRRRFDPHW